MNEKLLANFDLAIKQPLQQILLNKTVEELRQIDWFSLNPDFYIEQKKKQVAA